MAEYRVIVTASALEDINDISAFMYCVDDAGHSISIIRVAYAGRNLDAMI